MFRRHNEGGLVFITAGFPCQPHSVAGEQLGSEDERDMWPECFRSVCEIRPDYALFENVPNLLNTDGGRFFNRILSDLASIGYDAEWRVLEAGRYGAAQIRARLWILSYPHKIGIQGSAIQPILGKQNLQRGQAGIKVPKWGSEFDAFEARLCRSLHRLPDGLDRIKSLGNAIVPQVAQVIMETIKQSEPCPK